MVLELLLSRLHSGGKPLHQNMRLEQQTRMAERWDKDSPLYSGCSRGSVWQTLVRSEAYSEHAVKQ